MNIKSKIFLAILVSLLFTPYLGSGFSKKVARTFSDHLWATTGIKKYFAEGSLDMAARTYTLTNLGTYSGISLGLNTIPQGSENIFSADYIASLTIDDPTLKTMRDELSIGFLFPDEIFTNDVYSWPQIVEDMVIPGIMSTAFLGFDKKGTYENAIMAYVVSLGSMVKFLDWMIRKDALGESSKYNHFYAFKLFVDMLWTLTDKMKRNEGGKLEAASKALDFQRLISLIRFNSFNYNVLASMDTERLSKQLEKADFTVVSSDMLRRIFVHINLILLNVYDGQTGISSSNHLIPEAAIVYVVDKLIGVMEAHGCLGKMTMEVAEVISLGNKEMARLLMDGIVAPVKGEDLSDMWRSKEIGVGGYFAEMSRIINQAELNRLWKPIGDPEDPAYRLF